MTQLQETIAHRFKKNRRMSPISQKGTAYGSVTNAQNLGRRLAPYWDRPYEAPSNLTTEFSQIHTIHLDASKIYPKEALFYF